MMGVWKIDGATQITSHQVSRALAKHISSKGPWLVGVFPLPANHHYRCSSIAHYEQNISVIHPRLHVGR